MNELKKEIEKANIFLEKVMIDDILECKKDLNDIKEIKIKEAERIEKRREYNRKYYKKTKLKK